MTTNGRCECGAVRFVVTGELRRVVYCHCGQCRRTSGHYVAATACKLDELDIRNEEGLRWYRSSDFAQRGFCGVCGASVFWRPDDGSYMAIMAGTLEAPTGLKARMHIHTDTAGEYYTMSDGLPQHPGEHGFLWEGDDW